MEKACFARRVSVETTNLALQSLNGAIFCPNFVTFAFLKGRTIALFGPAGQGWHPLPLFCMCWTQLNMSWAIEYCQNNMPKGGQVHEVSFLLEFRQALICFVVKRCSHPYCTVFVPEYLQNIHLSCSFCRFFYAYVCIFMRVNNTLACAKKRACVYTCARAYVCVCVCVCVCICMWVAHILVGHHAHAIAKQIPICQR